MAPNSSKVQTFMETQLGNEIHAGQKDGQHVPISIMTASSVEHTMASISEAQTLAAQKMNLMK